MNAKLYQLLVFLAVTAILVSCGEENEIPENQVLPEKFSVDIPDALSSNTAVPNGRALQQISGDDIYENIRLFIWVGESGAEIVEDLISAVRVYNIQDLETFTIVSDDDGRTKEFIVDRDITFESNSYEYRLVGADEDSSIGLMMYWNTSPVEGVAFLQPYHIDRNTNPDEEDLMIQIDYSEANTQYDATMTVSVTGIEDSDEDGLNKLKLFVGEKEGIVDLIGNSNHPDITIIDPNYSGGRNYAFVGRGDQAFNIGVARVALPPSSVSTADNLFTKYEVYDVLEEELIAIDIVNQSLIDLILQNAEGPGYFDSNGFVDSGDNVPDMSGFTGEFVDLTGLTPFVPSEVRDLTITF